MLVVKGEGNIPGFLISQNPVSNLEYCVYQNWLSRVYVDYPTMYKNSQVNAKDSFMLWNEPSVASVLGHPAFGAYPVVGVTWYQAMEYCRWKNDRINESIVMETIDIDYMQYVSKHVVHENNFNTETYLAGHYYFPKSDKKRMKMRYAEYYDENNTKKEHLKMVYKPDFLYGYRMPSEDEIELTIKKNTFENNKPNKGVGRFTNILASQDINAKMMLKHYESSFKAYYQNNNQNKICEWLLDSYSPEPRKYQDMLARINNGGMEVNPLYISMYDQYGEIREKDSLGMFYFRIMDWLPGGTPLFAGNILKYSENRMGYFSEKLMDNKAIAIFQLYYKSQRIDTFRTKNGQYSYYVALHATSNSEEYRMYIIKPFISVEDDLKYIGQTKVYYYTNDSIINAKNTANSRLVKGQGKRFARSSDEGSNQIGFRMVVPWKGDLGRRAYRW
ncbi:MAG: SUMF1/EgtB/PvdO family nonheme iron enzyme [Bacteroidota bacterium]